MSRPKPTVLLNDLGHDINHGYFVYALRDGREPAPFYIGKASYASRPFDHIREAQSGESSNKHKINKINKIAREGVTLVIDIVFWSEDEQSTLLEEMRLIEKYGRRDKETGCLTNLTDGGDGISGYKHTDTAKTRISESLKARPQNIRDEAANKLRGRASGMAGKTHSDTTKRQISESLKTSRSFQESMANMPRTGSDNSFYGKKHSQDSKQAMSDWKKTNYQGENNPFYGKQHSPETKQKFSENNPAKRPEVKEKISKALKGRPWSEARRQAHNKRKTHV